MEKSKILVVDDEKEICEAVRSFLSRRNYDVFTATNAKEALEITGKEHPQIVLLDIRLENESGLDILTQIKKIAKDTKVIMVTALDDEASIRRAKALGADDYITKPFTASYLNDFISQRISRFGLQQSKE